MTETDSNTENLTVPRLGNGPHLMSVLSRRLLHRGKQKSAAILPKFHIQDMPRTDGGG